MYVSQEMNTKKWFLKTGITYFGTLCKGFPHRGLRQVQLLKLKRLGHKNCLKTFGDVKPRIEIAKNNMDLKLKLNFTIVICLEKF